jgi:hypothetical protein
MSNKQNIFFAFTLIIALFFSACEDPIDLDLGAPTEQLVIDAVINQTADTQFIYVSKSMAYLNNGNYQSYQLDSIGIIDTASKTYFPFQYKGKGVYYFVPPAANTFQIGHTYQLLAADKGQVYFSQSELHQPVNIDSFTYKYQEQGPFGGSKGYYVTLWAKDNVGVGDHYWFRVYRNDSLQSKPTDIIIAEDNSTTPDGKGDGDLFIVPIRENLTPSPYRIGDKVRVDVHAITPEMYYYLNLISTQLNNTGLFAVPPSNIPGNIFCLTNSKTKVLGFFCMTGKVSTPEIVIQ